MRIIVFGASGQTGSATVREALSRGHEVTAVVRDPARPVPEGAAVAVGDAADAAAVAALSSGHDAIVGAVRPPAGHEHLQAVMTESLLTGAADTAVRVLLIGGAATLTVPGTSRTVLDDERYLPAAYRDTAEASAAQYRRCLVEKRADWTYLSPSASLEPGGRTGRYRLGAGELLVDAEGVSRISVADLAVAVVDELESPRHRRSRFTAAAA